MNDQTIEMRNATPVIGARARASISPSAPSDAAVLARLREIAADMKPQLSERQRRRSLDPADFARLAEAGFLLTGVPAEQGGLWRGIRQSVRPYCEMVYSIATGDPSVALVAAMHPAVLCGWLAIEEAPGALTGAWRAQRDFCFRSAKEGALWGTLTSEPGSGGDILKTKCRAEPDGRGGFLLTGDKHFGSGSGISSLMVTTALPDGATVPTIFYMDMRGRTWDGAEGLKLLAEWDGHGMSATQSHAFRLKRFPATAIAWPESLIAASPVIGQLGSCLFTAVVLAIVEGAVKLAQEKLAPRKADLRAYERVGWTEIVNQAWTMRQVFNGMIASVESGEDATAASARGKVAAAELAEACMGQLGRVIGGGAFSRSAPFGQWAQDVRALGFLRPPWGLAFEQLFEMSWGA